MSLFTVDCPGCGRSQPRQNPDTLYWCSVCQAQFDDDSGEGGDYYTDPTKRAEKQEERAQRRRERRKR